jgi:SPP1 gp7 family putative phage head morphogenesis protein
MTVAEMQDLDRTLKILDAEERTVLRMYRQRRDEVLAVLKHNYATYLTDVPNADYLTTLNTYNRLKKMNKEFKGIYIKLNNGSRASITAAEKKVFEDAFYRNQYTMTFFSDRVGKDIKFQAINPLVKELAVTGDLDLLKEIRLKYPRWSKKVGDFVPPAGETLSSLLYENNAAGLREVISTVKRGLVNGESYTKQARRVKKVFNKNVSNTMRVVRTEGNRIANAGSYANSLEMAEQGLEIKRQWVATLDGRTRDRHASLDGQVVGVDEPFIINGMTAMYPGTFGTPAMDINCRCSVIDVVPGLEPTMRRGRDPVTGKSDIGNFENFREWKKRHNTDGGT